MTTGTSTITTTTVTTTLEATKPTTNAPKKNRSEAREQVALAWQRRRQSQELEKAAKNHHGNASTTSGHATKTSGHHRSHSNGTSSTSNSSHGADTVKQQLQLRPNALAGSSSQLQQQQSDTNNIKFTTTKMGKTHPINNWFFSALGAVVQNAHGLQRCTTASCQQQQQQPQPHQHLKSSLAARPTTTNATGKSRDSTCRLSPVAIPSMPASSSKTRFVTIQQQQQQRQRAANGTVASEALVTKPKPQPARRAEKTSGSKQFPSMLALHQASALSRQIENLLRRNEDLLEDDDDDYDEDDEETNQERDVSGIQHKESNGGQGKLGEHKKNHDLKDSNLLAILSTQYNLEKAVFEMAQSRSRAFWLIDLRTVVDRLVEWKRQYSTSSRAPSPPLTDKFLMTTTPATNLTLPAIRFLFRVSANSHPVLLRILTCCLAEYPNQVRLVTGNVWDLTQVHKFIKNTSKKTSSSSHAPLDILDDSTVVGKPDAYLRKALLVDNGNRKDSDKPLGRLVPKPLSCITVDGPEEVHRIWNSLLRASSRSRRQSCQGKRGRNEPGSEEPQSKDKSDAEGFSPATNDGHPWKKSPSLQVCLRLKPGSDPNTWPSVWKATQAALAMLSATGNSGDDIAQSRIAAVSMDLNELLAGVCAESTQTMVANPSALQALCVCLENVPDHQKVRLELTGPLELENAQRMEFLSQLSKHPALASQVHEICVDITGPLLSSAGALCTRVIGVREQTTIPKKQSNEDEQKEQPPGPQRRMHYYIDDGCYGSLYQEGGNGSSLHPVPLITTTRTVATMETDVDCGMSGSSTMSQPDLLVSTVWGPTCDGLDRVCSDIALPELRRDDWLVFPVQCSGEGLGTAFNGFCPPDTAFCVLGYFRD